VIVDVSSGEIVVRGLSMPHSPRLQGGELYVLAAQDFEESDGIHVVRMHDAPGILSPIVSTVPLQLLAYHAALLRGNDVDKPRNLAKSVTVE